MAQKIKPIRKAVFPVAGLGTRFLPATKAMPKEMLTIVDKPIIQIAVDEAKEAGIEHFIFVTGRNKHVIEDHFDKPFELEETLKARNKTTLINKLEKQLPPPGTISFTRQQIPLGLGHAVWCARHLIENEPFALLLPDMIIKGEKGCLKQMIELYNRNGGNIIAVEEKPTHTLQQYGVVGINKKIEENAWDINRMIEKPKIGEHPSNLIISGRYILQPEIFKHIDLKKPGAVNEIQITDAMIKLLEKQKFYALKFIGETFDCGDKLGFLTANIVYGLENNEISQTLKKEIKKRLQKN